MSPLGPAELWALALAWAIWAWRLATRAAATGPSLRAMSIHSRLRSTRSMRARPAFRCSSWIFFISAWARSRSRSRVQRIFFCFSHSWSCVTRCSSRAFTASRLAAHASSPSSLALASSSASRSAAAAIPALSASSRAASSASNASCSCRDFSTSASISASSFASCSACFLSSSVSISRSSSVIPTDARNASSTGASSTAVSASSVEVAGPRVASFFSGGVGASVGAVLAATASRLASTLLER